MEGKIRRGGGKIPGERERRGDLSPLRIMNQKREDRENEAV